MSATRKTTQTCRRPDVHAAHRVLLLQAAAAAHASPEKGGSPHPTVKVGAVLIGKGGKEIACAVNRFPHGIDRRRPERYANGARSLWINCAEQLALIDAAKKKADLKGAKLYVTLEPCAVCAGLIVEAGIKEVIVPVRALRSYARLKVKWKKSIEIGLSKLEEAGVKLTAVDVDINGRSKPQSKRQRNGAAKPSPRASGGRRGRAAGAQ